MSERNDGGPAFPVSPDEARGKVSSVHGGLTIRDYFAGQALTGWLATYGESDDPDDVPVDLVAAFAYELADAMLEAR